MSTAVSDRQLLFAALALQMDLVGGDKPTAGLKAWAKQPDRSLAEVPAHFATPDSVADMKKDAEFAALRDRDDFKQFLAGLEK